jgi:pyruvate-formate lyase-activating enzyme
MNQEDYLHPLTHCTMCEHRCGVNRLEGETGICRMTVPVVASATLHPAPPESYTVFMAGCNYKCLNCQNWTIAQLPDNGYQLREFVSAKELAIECSTQLNSPAAKLMGADRIFFFRWRAQHTSALHRRGHRRSPQAVSRSESEFRHQRVSDKHQFKKGAEIRHLHHL